MENRGKLQTTWWILRNRISLFVRSRSLILWSFWLFIIRAKAFPNQAVFYACVGWGKAAPNCNYPIPLVVLLFSMGLLNRSSPQQLWTGQRQKSFWWFQFNSWFSLTWWDGHVRLQNNGEMSLNFCIMIESNSHKNFFAIVLYTNMAAVKTWKPRMIALCVMHYKKTKTQNKDSFEFSKLY